MLKELIKLANHLDSKGYTKEADIIDSTIKRSEKTGSNFSDVDFKNIVYIS